MMIQPHRFKMQHTYKFKFDFVSIYHSLRISRTQLRITRRSGLHSADGLIQETHVPWRRQQPVQEVLHALPPERGPGRLQGHEVPQLLRGREVGPRLRLRHRGRAVSAPIRQERPSPILGRRGLQEQLTAENIQSWGSSPSSWAEHGDWQAVRHHVGDGGQAVCLRQAQSQRSVVSPETETQSPE